VLVLAGDSQPGPARNQDRQAGAPAKQLRHQRRRLHDVLEVVQQEQEFLLTEEGAKAIGIG
jgi:hypothetical protein